VKTDQHEVSLDGDFKDGKLEGFATKISVTEISKDGKIINKTKIQTGVY